MSAKLTLFPSRGASRYFLFPEGESRVAGRDDVSDLVLEDPRVSARHARFDWTTPGWTLVDLGSKNGTFVNGLAAEETVLTTEDWISFGGLLSQFELVSEEEIRALETERRARLQTSAELGRELAREADPRALLSRLLESVLTMAGAERGLVLLLGPAGKLHAEVGSGFSADILRDGRFSVSLGAIEKVLTTRRSVVAADAQADAFLGRRPSIVDRGIAALACVPLNAEDRTIGLIYVEGRKRGGGFTDLDLAILEAVADQAALVVATVRIERQIRELLGERAPDGDFFEELERQVGEIVRSGGTELETLGRAAPGP